MKEMTAAQISRAFDALDREGLDLPDLSQVKWDELDYFGWHDPGKGRAYLVTSLAERDVGIVLKTSANPHRGLCDLCLSVDVESGTRMLMAETWKKPSTNLGIMMCANLDCSASARGLKWVYQMEETITIGRRIERLQENVAKFARAVTGLGK